MPLSQNCVTSTIVSDLIQDLLFIYHCVYVFMLSHLVMSDSL